MFPIVEVFGVGLSTDDTFMLYIQILMLIPATFVQVKFIEVCASSESSTSKSAIAFLDLAGWDLDCNRV